MPAAINHGAGSPCEPCPGHSACSRQTVPLVSSFQIAHQALPLMLEGGRPAMLPSTGPACDIHTAAECSHSQNVASTAAHLSQPQTPPSDTIGTQLAKARTPQLEEKPWPGTWQWRTPRAPQAADCHAKRRPCLLQHRRICRPLRLDAPGVAQHRARCCLVAAAADIEVVEHLAAGGHRRGAGLAQQSVKGRRGAGWSAIVSEKAWAGLVF